MAEWKVIDRNHLMTCETMLHSVLAAEEVIKEAIAKENGKVKEAKVWEKSQVMSLMKS